MLPGGRGFPSSLVSSGETGTGRPTRRCQSWCSRSWGSFPPSDTQTHLGTSCNTNTQTVDFQDLVLNHGGRGVGGAGQSNTTGLSRKWRAECFQSIILFICQSIHLFTPALFPRRCLRLGTCYRRVSWTRPHVSPWRRNRRRRDGVHHNWYSTFISYHIHRRPRSHIWSTDTQQPRRWRAGQRREGDDELLLLPQHLNNKQKVYSSVMEIWGFCRQTVWSKGWSETVQIKIPQGHEVQVFPD